MPCAVAAQVNLVPNPSFEDTTHCPLFYGDFSTEHWYSQTAGSSPDLYHTCAVQIDLIVPSVPHNYNGWQWPRTGAAYMGIGYNPNFGIEGGEYIQCDLIEPLNSGKKYIVEFFISRADNSDRTPKNVGAFFSQDTVSSTVVELLPYLPQVSNASNQSLTDAVNWIRISDTIIANGGEQYLTIGVFSDNTGWTETDGTLFQHAYIFIDDVSVVEYEVFLNIPNVFTPNLDGANDTFQVISTGFINGELSVYNRWGQLVFSTTGKELQWDGRINNMNASAGVYYVMLTMQNSKKERIVKKAFVHLLR